MKRNNNKQGFIMIYSVILMVIISIMLMAIASTVTATINIKNSIQNEYFQTQQIEQLVEDYILDTDTFAEIESQLSSLGFTAVQSSTEFETGTTQYSLTIKQDEKIVKEVVFNKITSGETFEIEFITYTMGANL